MWRFDSLSAECKCNCEYGSGPSFAPRGFIRTVAGRLTLPVRRHAFTLIVLAKCSRGIRPYRVVALARGGFETPAVENADFAADILD